MIESPLAATAIIVSQVSTDPGHVSPTLHAPTVSTTERGVLTNTSFDLSTERLVPDTGHWSTSNGVAHADTADDETIGVDETNDTDVTDGTTGTGGAVKVDVIVDTDDTGDTNDTDDTGDIDTAGDTYDKEWTDDVDIATGTVVADLVGTIGTNAGAVDQAVDADTTMGDDDNDDNDDEDVDEDADDIDLCCGDQVTDSDEWDDTDDRTVHGTNADDVDNTDVCGDQNSDTDEAAVHAEASDTAAVVDDSTVDDDNTDFSAERTSDTCERNDALADHVDQEWC